MKLETLRISDLVSDPNNARKHDEKNLEAIKGSLTQFGQRKPIVIQGSTVIAGNGTMEAAKQLGWETIEVVRVPDDWSADQAKAFALADNRTAELAAWDEQVLAAQIIELKDAGIEVADFGFVETESLGDEIAEDTLVELPEDYVPTTKVGDIYQLGRHRLMCGDSTNGSSVAKLLNGAKAILLHADPPYGMGKEKDGVLNDNLYAGKLDEFQTNWWKAFRPYLEDNSSAYIWGNAPDLWRWWYKGGLGESEPLTFRNEIVWKKDKAQGMASSSHRMFPTGTERALFFMIGVQGFNTNADNYFEGYEPIRSYLADESTRLGWATKDLNRITGTSSMAQHWIAKSQWTFIRKEQYQALQIAASGEGFKKEYEELKKEYEELKKDFYSTRAFFDNSHDSMIDVWEAKSVSGEERYGHATPKPLELMRRVMNSSAPENGLVIEPFGGSGSTLIAAEQTNRVCYTMELDPKYVDTIIKRWETLTGQKAGLVS